MSDLKNSGLFILSGKNKKFKNQKIQEDDNDAISTFELWEGFFFSDFGLKSMKIFLFSFFYLILSFDLNNFQFQKYFIDSIFRVFHYTKFSFLLNFMILETLIVWGTTKIKHFIFLNLHFTNKILFVF